MFRAMAVDFSVLFYCCHAHNYYTHNGINVFLSFYLSTSTTIQYRYICNYIYYKSLEAEEQRLDSKAGATGAIGAATGTDTTGNWSDCKVRSIFIHLPLFTTIAKDVQIAFVKRAVAILCADDSCA